MDVSCLKCGEPYDTDTLRHELKEDVDEEYQKDWQAGKLVGINHETEIRTDLQILGWLFGANTLIVKQCPACKYKRGDGGKKAALRSILAEQYGDDMDGYAADMEDLGEW